MRSIAATPSQAKTRPACSPLAHTCSRRPALPASPSARFLPTVAAAATVVAAVVSGIVVVAGVIDPSRPRAKTVVVKIPGLTASISGPRPPVAVIPVIAVPVVSGAIVIYGFCRSDVGGVRLDDDFLRGCLRRGTQADARDRTERRKHLREPDKRPIHGLAFLSYEGGAPPAMSARGWEALHECAQERSQA